MEDDKKSMKFTRQDVRQHLAELGYANIDDEKLDEFCADLKRLIKYEEKKKNISKKLEQLEVSQQNLMSDDKENEESTSSSGVPKVNSLLVFGISIYVLSFVFQRKRRIRKEEKRRLKEEKLKQREASRTTSSMEDEFDGATTVSSDKPESSSLYIDVNIPASKSDSDLSKVQPLAASLIAQPPPGFIRVRSGPSVGRRPASADPVALHQRYRQYWDKFSVPGENRHDKLRWAVRGWMMGEEPL